MENLLIAQRQREKKCAASSLFPSFPKLPVFWGIDVGACWVYGRFLQLNRHLNRVSIELTLILQPSTLPSICETEGHLSGYPSQAPKLLESPLLRTQSANHTVIWPSQLPYSLKASAIVSVAGRGRSLSLSLGPLLPCAALVISVPLPVFLSHILAWPLWRQPTLVTSWSELDRGSLLPKAERKVGAMHTFRAIIWHL